MKTLLILTMTFFCELLLSDILIVPAQDVTVATFLERCQKNGYVCSHEYLIKKIISAETPKFNQLIENLNLLSDQQRKKLPEDIIDILMFEMVSVEQIQSLLQISEKSIVLEKSKSMDYLHQELTTLYKLFSSLEEKPTELVSYVIFKKKLSVDQFKKIQNVIRNYNFFKVDPFQISGKNLKEDILLTGDCEKNSFAPLITKDSEINQLYPLFKTDCSSDYGFHSTVNTVTDFTQSHQKTILWTIAVLGAGLFLNNYDIEFR